MADDHDAPHVLAGLASPLQPLAQLVASPEVEAGRERQRRDDVPARHLGLRRVREDRDGGGQRETGLQDPAELLRAEAEEPLFVGPGQAERSGP
jgi:hypothetical protein